jgi:hypothetical protein
MENQLWIISKDGKRRKAKQSACETCSKAFLQRLNGDYRFCSPSCSMVARKKRLKLICANCKKDFERAESKTKSASHGFHFCTRKCKEMAQSLSGSIEEIRPGHYGTGNNKGEIEKFFLSKVHEGCGCGEKQTYLLQVHHIDGNNSNNDWTNFELVCGNCHIKRHLIKIDGEWVYWTKALTPRELLAGL